MFCTGVERIIPEAFARLDPIGQRLTSASTRASTLSTGRRKQSVLFLDQTSVVTVTRFPIPASVVPSWWRLLRYFEALCHVGS
jgi:hypothetical protein